MEIEQSSNLHSLNFHSVSSAHPHTRARTQRRTLRKNHHRKCDDGTYRMKTPSLVVVGFGGKTKIYTRLRAQHTVLIRYDDVGETPASLLITPQKLRLGRKLLCMIIGLESEAPILRRRKKWVLHIPWRLLLWFFHFNIGVKFAILFHSATFLLRRIVMGSMTDRLAIILVLINPIMGSVLRRCTGLRGT